MILILCRHVDGFERSFLIFHEMTCMPLLAFDTRFTVLYLLFLIWFKVLMLSDSFSTLTLPNMSFVIMKLLKQSSIYLTTFGNTSLVIQLYSLAYALVCFPSTKHHCAIKNRILNGVTQTLLPEGFSLTFSFFTVFINWWTSGHPFWINWGCLRAL